jgi:hypothetical protein
MTNAHRGACSIGGTGQRAAAGGGRQRVDGPPRGIDRETTARPCLPRCIRDRLGDRGCPRRRAAGRELVEQRVVERAAVRGLLRGWPDREDLVVRVDPHRGRPVDRVAGARDLCGSFVALEGLGWRAAFRIALVRGYRQPEYPIADDTSGGRRNQVLAERAASGFTGSGSVLDRGGRRSRRPPGHKRSPCSKASRGQSESPSAGWLQ